MTQLVQINPIRRHLVKANEASRCKQASVKITHLDIEQD